MDGFQLFSQLTDQQTLPWFFSTAVKSISERISINSPLDSRPFILSRHDGQKVLKVSPLIFSNTEPLFSEHLY